jgi:hypothetical protein
MPWSVTKTGKCPASKPWGVVKEGGELEGCHETKAQAEAQQAALYASEERGIMSKLRELRDRVLALFREAGIDEEPGGDRERALSSGQILEQFWYSLSDSEEHWSAWPLDIYLDGGETYALVAERGRLYRVGLGVGDGGVTAGEWTEVETVHQPVGRTRVSRQADGRYRWLNISATATLNRVAEIDSRALFDDFIRRAEESGEYPGRDFYHLGEAARLGQCDYLARDDAVLISSGLFDETPLALAVARAIEAEPGEWGDSISYRPEAEAELVEVAEGVRVPVYNAGVLRYISTLPESRAASLFTTATVGEVTRMRADIKEALERLKGHGLSDEEIAAIEGAVDGTNRAIQDGGIINREEPPDAEPEGDQDPEPEQAGDVAREEPEAEGEPEAEPDPEPEAGREVELDDEALAAIVERVLSGEAVAGLQAQVAALTEQVDGLARELSEARALNVRRSAEVDGRLVALEKTDEEKRRTWQADLPPRARDSLRVTYRPREANAGGDGDGPANLAAVAEQTMSKWGA